VAADRWTENGRDIYIWNLERESLSRLTDDPGQDGIPIWSADGNRIFFSSNRGGVAFNLYSRAADGTGTDELMLASQHSQFSMNLSPDGAQLFVIQEGSDGWDIVAVDVEEPRQARALLATKAGERFASVSPDGRWVAYDSDDEGRIEVFVGPFPAMGQRRWKISSGGGALPRWSDQGDEIFFYGPSGSMMAAQVELTPTFVPGKVIELFSHPSEAEFSLGLNGDLHYDVSPLGGRFLMATQSERTRDERIVVVMNWFEELKAKVPVQ
jgi:serine/threonine-protein kinase